MKTLLLAGLATLMLSPAMAQSGLPPRQPSTDGAIVVREPNTPATIATLPFRVARRVLLASK